MPNWPRRSAATRRGQGAPAAAAQRLAAYVRAAAARLDALPIADFGDGKLSFPDPTTISAPACEAQA